MRALIVDDEAPARSELRYLLEETGRVEQITEASGAREAIKQLVGRHIDVIFLDIQMPKASGMQLAETLQKIKNPPPVVFVTAYSEYALEAFDVDAIDYLMKPVETDRLNQALDKVQARMRPKARSANTNERIPLKKGDKTVYVPIDEIRYIEAKDDYSCVYTVNDHYLSTTSLTKFEQQLDPYGFARVHRGYIVNLSYVDARNPMPSGNLQLTIRGVEGKKITVSRRRVAEVKRRLPKENSI